MIMLVHIRIGSRMLLVLFRPFCLFQGSETTVWNIWKHFQGIIRGFTLPLHCDLPTPYPPLWVIRGPWLGVCCSQGTLAETASLNQFSVGSPMSLSMPCQTAGVTWPVLAKGLQLEMPPAGLKVPPVLFFPALDTLHDSWKDVSLR